MIRKVRVTVHRKIYQHAIVEMLVDDERGTHRDLHDEAAVKAEEDNAWKFDEEHIDHFSSHFEWLEPHDETFAERQEAYRKAHPDDEIPF